MKSPIRVNPESVIDTMFAITLGNGEWHVRTVEHLLSFFYIYGITDILIEVDGGEIPIYDGSISPIINLFSEKKFYTFDEINEPIKIINPIWIREEDLFIVVLPSDTPKISYTISYDHPFLKMQYAYYPLLKDVLINEIAPSRTFGFLKDVEYLRNNSLAMGGSLENTLVIGEDEYLNEPRFEDECVRHKILDFLGDISLIGRPILGYFLVSKSGHTFNMKFVKKVKRIFSSLDIGSRIDFQKQAKKTI
jgi:UDP-3-O-[3-hydroxymyristoyl] N-acetylglucosamine deacetylase